MRLTLTFQRCTLVLARYSGENTVFRELLQNADDASATAVEIKFLSSTESDINQPTPSNAPLPDLKTHKIARVVARNNGIPFRDQDWCTSSGSYIRYELRSSV